MYCFYTFTQRGLFCCAHTFIHNCLCNHMHTLVWRSISSSDERLRVSLNHIVDGRIMVCDLVPLNVAARVRSSTASILERFAVMGVLGSGACISILMDSTSSDFSDDTERLVRGGFTGATSV